MYNVEIYRATGLEIQTLVTFFKEEKGNLFWSQSRKGNQMIDRTEGLRQLAKMFPLNPQMLRRRIYLIYCNQ